MNRIILTGNLTADSELTYTQGGVAICKNTIAVSDGYGDKKQTYFIRLTLFQKLAESFAEHSFKGQQIGIEGKLVLRQYETASGDKKTTTEVHVDRVEYFKWKDKQASKSEGQFDHSQKKINDSDLPF